MKRTRKHQLENFMHQLEISFHDLTLLDCALTHSSYSNECKDGPVPYNERLEFLGDAILDFVVGEYLFCHYPNMPEGDLSRARASVVSETPLAACCAAFHMGDFLLMGKGEESTGGRQRPSILADAFEAVVGALYIDSSYDEARRFILTQLKAYLDLIDSGHYLKDYKTLFQEYVQQDGVQQIHYELCREEGPDHDKTFYMKVYVNGVEEGEGAGKTKKDAEQQAAYEALKKSGQLS